MEGGDVVFTRRPWGQIAVDWFLIWCGVALLPAYSRAVERRLKRLQAMRAIQAKG